MTFLVTVLTVVIIHGLPVIYHVLCHPTCLDALLCFVLSRCQDDQPGVCHYDQPGVCHDDQPGVYHDDQPDVCQDGQPGVCLDGHHFVVTF